MNRLLLLIITTTLAFFLSNREVYSQIKLGIYFEKFEVLKETPNLKESLEKTLYNCFSVYPYLEPVKILSLDKNLEGIDYLLLIELKVEEKKDVLGLKLLRSVDKGRFQKIYEKREKFNKDQVLGYLPIYCDEIKSFLLTKDKVDGKSFINSLNIFKGLSNFFSKLFLKEDEFRIIIPIPAPPPPPIMVQVPYPKKDSDAGLVFQGKSLKDSNRSFLQPQWEWF